MDAFVLLFTLAILLALGMPVAFAVGLSAVAGALWIDLPLEALMIQITSGVNKFTLLAIPFFILAGAIMAEGGIARRLVNFAYIFVGFIRGGLSLVNIVASTFFGAISGSSVADTASIGTVMIPEMEKKGYPREYAAAVTASGSVQAILIPPSHNSVIYSLAAGGTVSIATLFIAGVLPGLILGLSLMVLCLGFARKRGYPKGERVPFKQALKIFFDALWGLMTVVIILGGILSGIFTATESAAVACLWAFFVTMFIYRDYKWNELPKLMCHRQVAPGRVVSDISGFRRHTVRCLCRRKPARQVAYALDIGIVFQRQAEGKQRRKVPACRRIKEGGGGGFSLHNDLNFHKRLLNDSPVVVTRHCGLRDEKQAGKEQQQ